MGGRVSAPSTPLHIAQLYDLDIAEGELFLSLEFVPGATRVEVTRACRQANHLIPLGFRLMAVRDTAVALHYAHTFTNPLGRPSPVIHRDVAENNILVTYEGDGQVEQLGYGLGAEEQLRAAAAQAAHPLCVQHLQDIGLDEQCPPCC